MRSKTNNEIKQKTKHIMKESNYPKESLRRKIPTFQKKINPKNTRVWEEQPNGLMHFS